MGNSSSLPKIDTSDATSLPPAEVPWGDMGGAVGWLGWVGWLIDVASYG